MKENYSSVYLMLIFPYNFHKKDYFKIWSKCYEGLDYQIMSLKVNDAIEKRYLLIKEEKISLNIEIQQEAFNEFINLSEYNKSYFFEKCEAEIVNFFQISPYKKLVDLFLNYIKLKIIKNNNDEISESRKKISEELNKLIIENCDFSPIVSIFNSVFVDDELKLELIDIFYKLGKNTLVVKIYESIMKKELIDFECFFKISSSYFLLRKYQESNKIIQDLKEKELDNNYIQMIEIIDLMYKFETRKYTQITDKELLQKFNDLVKNVIPYSNCAKLILKFSSSLLSHEEAINFIMSSNIDIPNYQIYNNLGALYFAEGYKKICCNPKDKKYIAKAEKCLNFAKFLVEEKNEFSPYLELNLLSFKFFKESRKKIKNYSPLYKKFKKLIHVADSSYFNSIVLCNCYLLELLTTKNETKMDEYSSRLDAIKNETKDQKIVEKIESFLNFNTKNAGIPIWIITETHF